jgi:hypothetical protein
MSLNSIAFTERGVEDFLNDEVTTYPLPGSNPGLTRSVDVGVYDPRARSPQPVAGAMGERFLDWQLAQTPEESWAECERHAKAILEGTAGTAPLVVAPEVRPALSEHPQQRLFGGS